MCINHNSVEDVPIPALLKGGGIGGRGVLSKSQTTEMWVGICPEGLWIFSGVPKLKLQLCLRLGLFFWDMSVYALFHFLW